MTNISDIQQFFLQSFWVGKPAWTLDDMPDLTGKVVIVTGGSSGLGTEATKALLQHNAKVYVASRNRAKTEHVLDYLYTLTGKKAVFLQLDLADLVSVKNAVAEFLSKERELHILFNNGGVMMPPLNHITTQGYDLQFGTNVLGHFYFTKLLLSVLLSTAKSCPEGNVRVINVSSAAHYLGLWNPLDFNTLKDGPQRRKRWMTEFMYMQSKFANVVFSNQLARRYGHQGLISIAVNPGNLSSTQLGRHLRTWWTKLGVAVLMVYPPQWGALTVLWAGTSPDAASLNGKFVGPWCKVRPPQSATLDPQLGEDLWTWMEEQVEQI